MRWSWVFFWFAKMVLVWLKDVFFSSGEMIETKTLLFFQEANGDEKGNTGILWYILKLFETSQEPKTWVCKTSLKPMSWFHSILHGKKHFRTNPFPPFLWKLKFRWPWTTMFHLLVSTMKGSTAVLISWMPFDFFRGPHMATSQLAVANGTLGFVDCCGCYIRCLMSDLPFYLFFLIPDSRSVSWTKSIVWSNWRYRSEANCKKNTTCSRGCVGEDRIEGTGLKQTAKKTPLAAEVVLVKIDEAFTSHVSCLWRVYVLSVCSLMQFLFMQWVWFWHFTCLRFPPNLRVPGKPVTVVTRTTWCSSCWWLHFNLWSLRTL